MSDRYRFDDTMFVENRNLQRIQGLDSHQHDRRYKLLRQGKLDTVNLINKMPPTEHEPSSFKLDCCFSSVNKSIILFYIPILCDL